MFDSKAYDKLRNQFPERKLWKKKAYIKNRDKILSQNKLSREKNIDKIKARIKSQEHKTKRNLYLKEKRKDPNFLIIKSLRDRLSKTIKSQGTYKSNKTLDYVGCNKEQLKNHLESLFVIGMSWNNYGKWHIDHIYPLSKIDLSQESNIRKVMNYKNLQPLWASDNVRKSASIPAMAPVIDINNL